MASLDIECQICLEWFPTSQIDKVACGSSVDHTVCFGCEKTWRSKMAIHNGVRIMNCPTCRQPEKYRTIESLQREASSTSFSARVATETEQANEMARRAVARAQAHISTVAQDTAIARIMQRLEAARAAAHTDVPVVVDLVYTQRARCASGRNCRSTSQTGRSLTYLKCTHCKIVFCCRTCKECVDCRPIVE